MNIMKLILVMLSSLLLSLPAYAKLYVPKKVIELDEEFLKSLNVEQLHYLEKRLTKVKLDETSNSEADEFEFIDIDYIETLRASNRTIKTSEPTEAL